LKDVLLLDVFKAAVPRSVQKTASGLSDPTSTVIAMTDEQLRVIVAGVRLDPYSWGSPRFVGVVDANAILSSVGNDCRKGTYWRSGLLRMTDRSTAALYAADHVYGEVYEHLPEISQWSKIPVGVLQTRFEKQYLPLLRFVTVDMTEIIDPVVFAIADVDDRPTGQLAKLVAPCVVFSEDRHLRKPGLAPDDWRLITTFAVDLVEGAAKQYQVEAAANGFNLPLSAAIELIRFATRRTGLSPWLIGGVVVGAGALVLKDPERRKAPGKHIMPIVDALGKEMSAAAAQEQRGIQRLREVMLPAPAVPSVKQQAAIALARQRYPLLAREVQELMLTHFRCDLVPTVAEVRAVLTDGSEFVQPERYRWQFGRQADATVRRGLPFT
jgi:hypothetical protein